jgi:hypothetical protein
MKARYITMIPVLLLLMVIVSSCRENRIEGKGTVETQNRNITSFSGIEIAAPVTVKIKIVEGSTPGIQLKGYPNVLKEIKTDIENGKLHIHTNNLVHFINNEEIIAEITAPTLNTLIISGASDVDIEGKLVTNIFELVVSGAGDIKMQSINSGVLNATLSGAGNLQINGGEVNSLNYTVTGAGEISSFPLLSKEATVSVTGMGDVDISVADKLDATVTGAGDINYKGHPSLSTHITGAGSINEEK